MDWQTLGGLAGGVGLFLIGMNLLTDGLTQASGTSLRNIIQRATSNRFTAFGAGAILTALVQSSSATTLATIGFVSAGLLSFPAALSVILGANLGTTSTAWIVSAIGFKIKASAFAMPMIAAGALLKLFSRGKYTQQGMALAGFGLVFVGIDALQAAMQTAGPGLLPTESLSSGPLGLGLLVLIGVVMTVIMQSSSAAVATTLAALYAGTLTFDQAAAMVIGQNVGTTVTAGLAAIGGSLEAKRAALAHLLFNVITALIALLLLKPMTHLVLVVGARSFAGNLELGLALFHTAFNILGVALFLPLTPQFAALIMRALPEPEGTLHIKLDPSTLQLPELAVVASQRAASELLKDALPPLSTLMEQIAHPPAHKDLGDRLSTTLKQIAQGKLSALTGAEEDAAQVALDQLEQDIKHIDTIRDFLAKLSTRQASADTYKQHTSLLHALEHLQRLMSALQERQEVMTVHHHEPLRLHAARLAETIAIWRDLHLGGLPIQDAGPALQELERRALMMAAARAKNRVDSMELAARGEISPLQAEQLVRAMRWLDRVNYHLWRACHHLYSPPSPHHPLELGAPEPHSAEADAEDEDE